MSRIVFKLSGLPKVRTAFLGRRHIIQSNFFVSRNASWSSNSQVEGFDRVQKVIELFRGNPKLKESLDGFQKILESKGILPDGKEPSVMQMMKILTDREVRDKLKELKQEMNDANIELSQEDLNAFMSLYGFKK